MEFQFEADIWYWKGPAPHHFVTVPARESAEIKSIAKSVTYGWGMIPVVVTLGSSTWETALWEKDGKYIVPLRAAERRKEDVEVGDVIQIHLQILKAHNV